MQPYNYTIDLPQPPAKNFLQNIMGIAQLQQMGQQQEIAAQQAAFQQQMQPLEMDKVREQIKAAQASAAQSAASTRGLNISADEAKRQQDYIKEVDAFTSKPVSEWAKQDVERLASLSITRDPKIGKGLQDFYASQKEPELKLIDNYAMKAGIAISQGRKDVADKITKEGIAEADKLGFKTASAFFKFGDSQIADDPAEAYATIVGHLARDKNKLDQFIAASELKGKLAETEAKTKKELAAARVEEAKLTPGGKEMSDNQQNDINKLTYASSELRNTTSAFDEQLNLILNFAEQNPKEFKTGALASIENWASGKQGVAQQAKNLRSNFQRFATEDWIKRAEPLKGGLNKEEGERLERGVPNIMTATPSELLNFGRLVSKINLLEADQKELNAAWQQNARSLQAKAPAEFEAAGITVRAGERWSEAQTRLRDSYKKKNEAQLQEDVLRLKRIEQAGRSGQSPVPNMYNLGGAPQQQQPVAAPNQSTISSDRQSLLNRYR